MTLDLARGGVALLSAMKGFPPKYWSQRRSAAFSGAQRSLCRCLIIGCALVYTCCIAEPTPGTAEPFQEALNELARCAESAGQKHDEIVAEAVKKLADKATPELEAMGYVKVASVIGYAVDKDVLEARRKGRLDAINLALEGTPLKREKGLGWLHISAGILGQAIEVRTAVAIAVNSELPPTVRTVALEAVAEQPTLLPDIEPQIRGLLSNDWSYLYTDVGGASSRRKYPIRDLAKRILERMRSL
jgi:hypothetical protein